MMPYVLAATLALGAFGGWRVTTWAYDADYKAQVEDMAKKHDADVKASEGIIRASLEKNQKTQIIYRTIKEKANATTNNNCLDGAALKLWREATTRANAPEADKPDDSVRSTSDAIKRRIKVSTP